MEAKAGARCRADLLGRDKPEHHRAGRQAIAVDNHALAGRAHFDEGFKVFADLAAIVLGDPHSSGRRRDAARQHGGANTQIPKMDHPTPFTPFLPTEQLASWRSSWRSSCAGCAAKATTFLKGVNNTDTLERCAAF